MDWKKALLEKGIREIARLTDDATKTARHVARAADGAAQTARHVAQSKQGRQVVEVARIAVQSGPVLEVAKMCGRAGVAGAVVDGSLGGMQALKALRDGQIDGTGALKHVGAEAGCGFVTSSAGTAGTVAVYLVTGTMGPAALALGMGASMGSRWLYRQVIKDTLSREQQVDSKADDDESSLEEIGPKPQSDEA